MISGIKLSVPDADGVEYQGKIDYNKWKSQVNEIISNEIGNL